MRLVKSVAMAVEREVRAISSANMAKSKELTKELWKQLLPKLKYVLSDCDGVLWHANVALPGSSEAFKVLRSHGLQVGFVTNNSTKSRNDLIDKFKQMNFQVSPEEIFCVNNVAARYLKSRNVTGRVYMIGTEGLQTELEGAGFMCNPAGPDPTDNHYQSWLKMRLDPNVEAVVVSYDYHFSLAKVCHAVTHLENPKCLFVATERDARVTSASRTGMVLPSTGALVAAVEASAGRPPVLIGKPSSTMADMIREQYPDLRPDNTLFIGDYLDTDIGFGVLNGFHTLLVETGMHTRYDIDHNTEGSPKPSFYTKSVADLIDFME